MTEEQDSKINELKDNLVKIESESTQLENRRKEFQPDLKKQKDSLTRNINQGKKDLLGQIDHVSSTVSELSARISSMKGDLESEKGNERT